MIWTHKVSREWMEARKKYLTASGVSSIIPFTATGKPRNVDSKYFEIWAATRTAITEDDLYSHGPAARGHLLEHYAVAEFNALRKAPWLMQPWDDALIFNDHGMAFSPDGMMVSQNKYQNAVEIDEDQLPFNTGCVEVKSYAYAKHYACGVCDKSKLEERWQLAHAMAVSDKISVIYLVFYNPSCKERLFVHTYKRDDLEKEIKLCKEAAEEYFNRVPGFEEQADLLGYPGKLFNEQQIQEMLLLDQNKTVINPR